MRRSKNLEKKHGMLNASQTVEKTSQRVKTNQYGIVCHFLFAKSLEYCGLK